MCRVLSRYQGYLAVALFSICMIVPQWLNAGIENKWDKSSGSFIKLKTPDDPFLFSIEKTQEGLFRVYVDEVESFSTKDFQTLYNSILDSSRYHLLFNIADDTQFDRKFITDFEKAFP